VRLVVFSSMPAAALDHLLWRLAIDLPEVTVAGILYETNRPTLGRGKRARRFFRLLKDPDFRVYAAARIGDDLKARTVRLSDWLLRGIHAALREPNGPPLSLESFAERSRIRGVAFHITRDLHDAGSLEFVRSLGADLGLIYGTRILKPTLFTLPRRGSINIHKHRVPDYRGCGAPGLWELRDGRPDLTVTVHRVVADLDAGGVLGERTIPIEPFDTLESLGMKADVVGVDLLIDVLRTERLGHSVERPQGAGGHLYKGYQPHQIHALERRIRSQRPQWRPVYTRNRLKLILRTAALPFVALRNRRRRRGKRFPIVVLYHHLTSDRPKFMSLPTAQFARHVRFLKRHYRIVSVDEAIAMLAKDEVPEPTVVLTLDDGYAENFAGLRAVAELERVPVTICVCTQHVADRSELAHDVQRGERGFPSLGWEEVRYLDRHGVTIASHTRTHHDCGTGGYAELVVEIAGSRRDLETELGHRIDVFAFPKGKPRNVSPAAYRLALQHYSVVMSASAGENTGPFVPPEELRRYCHPDTIWELELQVQALLDRAAPRLPEPQDQDTEPSPALPQLATKDS
jgi:peptidoglycan/xylan/chitin deacetylase (PgdA/CDA1 family)/folate-dependent phosphoribosylglycinamide formyltransferase PurN